MVSFIGSGLGQIEFACISGLTRRCHSAVFATIDVTEGGGDGFSLEAADGVRFIVRSRRCTDAEAAELDAAGPPPRGPTDLPAVPALSC
jgi:Protein of unknown function (DUF779)